MPVVWGAVAIGGVRRITVAGAITVAAVAGVITVAGAIAGAIMRIAITVVAAVIRSGGQRCANDGAGG